MSPTRSCIACRRRKQKSELFRIVAKADTQAFLDKEYKENSRGIYLCKNKECIQKCENIINKEKFNVKISINTNSLLKLLEELKSELWE